MIFDASSTYIVIKGKDLQGLRNSDTLDLAFYEIGNSIIQEERMGLIDGKATTALSEVVSNLPEIMNVAPYRAIKA